MNKFDFAAFRNRYEGRPGWVVGRGPTLYQYEDLAAVEGPVFFINDSVSQEDRLAANCDSFFFAHDISMAVWLGKIRSTAVLVTDHPYTAPPGKGLIRGENDPLLRREGNVVLYRQHGEFKQATLLERSRLEIASSQQLYIKSGTIHSLLHFTWYLGCSKLYLIGCDGLPSAGYDRRLPNLSESVQYGALYIRSDQDKMLHSLKIPVEYLGTPPHRMHLECQLVTRNHKQSKILDLLDDIIQSAHAMEGASHTTLERTGDSKNIFLFRLQSNSVREFLELVEKVNAFPRLHELMDQGSLEHRPLISMRAELY